MKPHRFQILAVEPDAERAANLKRFIHECVDGADVLVAHSSEVAIAAMAFQPPDLVIASALLSPRDEEHLMSHLKRHERMRELRVLTVPPLVAQNSEAETRRRWPWSFLTRRAVRTSSPFYDLHAVSDRINEALEQLRTDHREPTTRQRGLALVKSSISYANAARATGPLPHDEGRSVVRSRRHRAHRWRPETLHWHRAVVSPSGVELRLVNISTTGLLVESGSRMTPDSYTDLRLCGSETDILVPVRFVRSEVAEVTGLGVKYFSAAAFIRKLALVPERIGPRRSITATPTALAELLVKATGQQLESGCAWVGRSTFEEGLRTLISARAVNIRAKPQPDDDGSDSIYLTIPTDTRAPAVLQATFEPDYEPTEEEFKLLKAAAAAAAVVLQYESQRHVLSVARSG